MDLQTLQDSLLKPNTDHLVKNECLEQLSLLAEKKLLSSAADGNAQSEVRAAIKLLRDFSHYHDPRVRSTALTSLLKLYESGGELDISLYSEFCDLLNDEYERVRITAMKLIQILSYKYDNTLVYVDGEQIRIADDAFAKLCSMMSDSSITVRVEAATLLGKFTNISIHFLHQTLDKKLMSNLRKKKSAHQRHKEAFETGGWMGNRKWTDDSPLEAVCPEAVNLINIGACGAFIHGLEDEFYDVRMAALESLCTLAQAFPSFAHKCLDFLVDMFNDEIQEIRLKAIQCLTKISRNGIILREDQIDIVLALLEDFSIDIREELHLMLGNCRLSSKTALGSTINNLLSNLKKYPSDRDSVWRCFQKLGQNNVNLTLAMVTELLAIHPFLKLTEKSLDNPEYIAILILVFNAAKYCPTMIDMLENYHKRHYIYLKDSFPHLVPTIRYLIGDNLQYDFNSNVEDCDNFFHKIFERLRTQVLNEKCSEPIYLSVLTNAINDMTKLSNLHSMIAPACKFFSTYLQSQISLRKILSNRNWINTFLLSPSQSSIFRSSLQQLLSSTFIMLHSYHGLSPLHIICIQQTRVKAMALQLIAIIHGSNVSALGLCEAFLSEMNMLRKLLAETNTKPNNIIAMMIKKISCINQPKPGSVARALQPILLTSKAHEICDFENLLNEHAFHNFKQIRLTTAVIVEPRDQTDMTLNFTAGLVLSLSFHALLENVHDIRNVRIKVQYPDHQIQLIQPKLTEFRERNKSTVGDRMSEAMETGEAALGEKKEMGVDVRDYKLITKICLSSNGVWSEPSHVSISLLLDFRDVSSTTLNTTQIYSSFLNKSSGIRSTKSEDNLVIEISKPVRLLVCPIKPKKLVL